MATDILGLTEIAENQAGKYLTHNEALRQIEAMLIRVLSRTTGLSEISPSNGDVYIVNAEYGDYTQWAASTTYSEGDVRVPTTHNGYRYKVTDAGSGGTGASGSSEPTWPTTIGNTVTDGDLTWECESGIWPTSSNYAAGDIAHYYSSAWHYYTPVEGLSIWCMDEKVRIYYDGAAWGYSLAGKINMSVSLLDQDAVGVVDEMAVDVNSTGFAAALYIASDGNLEEADASAAGTLRCMGLALETGTGASKKILRWGRVRNDEWAWTVGGLVYVSTTAGQLTQTPPSNAGEFVQVVGEAEASNIIMFAPSYDAIELSS